MVATKIQKSDGGIREWLEHTHAYAAGGLLAVILTTGLVHDDHGIGEFARSFYNLSYPTEVDGGPFPT
jgi:hypothetical protein